MSGRSERPADTTVAPHWQHGASLTAGCSLPHSPTFMQACRSACSLLRSQTGQRAVCRGGSLALEQRAAWATPRGQQHMRLDARAMAVGTAAALGLTLTWLHRQRHRRSASGSSNNSNNCHGVKLVPRSRPLLARPDEVSMVSYNILCERCERAAAQQSARVLTARGFSTARELLVCSRRLLQSPPALPCCIAGMPTRGGCHTCSRNTSTQTIAGSGCRWAAPRNEGGGACSRTRQPAVHRPSSWAGTPSGGMLARYPLQASCSPFPLPLLQVELAAFGSDLIALQEVTVDR